MNRTMSLISLMALFSLASVSAFGANVKGMINSRTGETLTSEVRPRETLPCS